MRHVIAAITFFTTLLLLAVAGGGLWGLHEFREPGPLAQVHYVVIEKGMGLSEIASQLAQNGVITNPVIFKIAARLQDVHTRLHAGEYEIAAGASMSHILDKMVRGDVYDRKLTFREGLTSWQIVQMLNKAENLSGDALTDVPPEGSLLPETYRFMRTDNRQSVIGQMEVAMKAAQEELWPARVSGLPFDTIEEAVILASIVEKETGMAGERRKVAGVFVNRLKRGMPLQSDPTAIYALTKGEVRDDGMGPLGRRLLRKDLEVDSPYNTYRYPGLPPGPICNPGRESLAAVLNPESHDYIYFVADGTGGHVFARTLGEHEANVAQWRRIRSQER
ncbi:MAG: endolytic transglycosylase MltG [Micavibrio aeruginosavorus]|uniref:Endolytic murein transglycosylase n=1 Tax=Micavibrio aeruginosavorus TaxID=349221 RepID=A0A7T5R311_9BACT|nr:MAG: endolytic transglycosylase MltG [Micavibrio aeruginosavorus]